MYNLIKYIYTLFIAQLLVSCHNKHYNQSIVKIDLEQAHNQRNKVHLGLKFFITNSIEYIKLSIPSDVSINESFLRLYADGNNIILIGFRQIYVFDRMSGQLKREIGNVGRGPKEYENTLHYNAYDEKRKVITAGKRGGQSLIEYSINGDVVKEINFTRKVGDVVIHFHDDIYATYVQNRFGNNIPRIILLNKLSKEINIFYHHIRLKSEPKRSRTKKGKFYKFDDRLMFFEEYIDTLYQITNDKIVPMYYISMGQFAPKYMDQFDLNYRKSGRMDENIHIVVMFESARYIFIRYAYKQYWYWHAVYDKDLNITLAQHDEQGIENDIDDFLPWKSITSVNTENELIGYTEAYNVVNWFDNHKVKAARLPAHLQNLRSVSENDAPIVMIARLKK